MLYGVWFGGRRTAVVVDSKSASTAKTAAKELKKRGGENVEKVRRLTEAERAIANKGDWVRTGKDKEPAGYNKSKRGYGPKPGKKK
jgi:hypothetical protein